MAVPFSHAATSYLDNYDTELNDAVKRADGIIAVFGAKGRIKEETSGGDNFRTRILYGTNPNIGFGGIAQEVPTAATEAKTMASVPQKFIRGSIVLNDVTLDRSAKQGDWALGDYIKDEKQAATAGYVQAWADALRQAAPGANDPLSLLPSSGNAANGILSPQASGSQTATTAGISRQDNSWWRNQYSSTSTDISSEAGRSLLQQLYLSCVFGSSKEDEPDFGLTSGLVISDLTQGVNTNRRGGYEEELMAKLKLSGIMFENAMLIRDSSTRLTSTVAFINTRDLYLKFLKATSPSGLNAGARENWDQNNGWGNIPVTVMPFQHDINSFHWISLFRATASLVPAQLRTHGLADNVV